MWAGCVAGMLGLPAITHAGSFVEFGIGVADQSTCIRDGSGCSDSPFGSLAIGYSLQGFSVQVEHWSSLVEKDRGLNLLSIKYRIEAAE